MRQRRLLKAFATATAVLITAGTLTALTTANASAAEVSALATANTGTYYALEPARVLDTRSNGGPLGQNAVRNLTVAGQGGVPAAGVSAVVLNVTVTGPTAGSFLTVYPAGVARPGASSLNYGPGWTGANMVTVGLGTGGAVSIFNRFGSVQVIVDVTGFYAADDTVVPSLGTGSQYLPFVPVRLLDSRLDFPGRVPAGGRAVAGFTFEDAAFDASITAAAVNVTAVDPVGGAGFFTTWSGIGDPPFASTLNYNTGDIVPNMAIVPVAWCFDCDPAGNPVPSISVYTNRDAHVLVDIVGVFHDGSLLETYRFAPIVPQRIVDSRLGIGLPGVLGPKVTGTVTTPANLATDDLWGLAMNVTAVAPTATGFVTVWPSGNPRPGVSNLNTKPGLTLPNSVYTEISFDWQFDVYNAAGNTHIVADVVGLFYLPAPAAGAAGADARTASSRWRATVPSANGSVLRPAGTA